MSGSLGIDTVQYSTTLLSLLHLIYSSIIPSTQKHTASRSRHLPISNTPSSKHNHERCQAEDPIVHHVSVSTDHRPSHDARAPDESALGLVRYLNHRYDSGAGRGTPIPGEGVRSLACPRRLRLVAGVRLFAAWGKYGVKGISSPLTYLSAPCPQSPDSRDSSTNLGTSTYRAYQQTILYTMVTIYYSWPQRERSRVLYSENKPRGVCII